MVCVRCFMLVFTLLSRGCPGVKAATPSVVSCPQYVAENRSLLCACTTSNCLGSIALSWVGQVPASNELTVQQVKRGDIGTRYTCLLICDGQNSTVDYTLRVAYGPTSDNMSISGDLPFKTNGTQVLSLTCLATDVNPAATYFWRGSICGNVTDSNTCSFVPQRKDDMEVTTCLARNSFITHLQSSKDFTIYLQYTPPASPLIQGPGQILKAGDTLSCTVTGGKPLVQSVSFSCDNPHHPDQNDAVNSRYVTSYITIDTSNATNDNMTCHCSAHWVPEPSYYTTSVSASYLTGFPPRLVSSDGPGHSSDTAVNMSEQGIDIQLRAYPAPDSFRFTGYKDKNNPAGEDISSDYGMLTATLSQRGPGSPEVTCHIRPGYNVQMAWLYVVNISNGFGSVQYYFNVIGVPSPPSTKATTSSEPDVGGIVGGVVGGVVALVIVVVVVVVVWKRKYHRYEKPQPRRDQDSSPYTGLHLMQGTGQPPSPHHENSPQNAQSLSTPNYANMTAEPGNQPASGLYVNTQLKKASNLSLPHYANAEPRPDLAQSSGDYVNLETTNSNYEQLQNRTETEGNVYKTLNIAR